MTNVGDELRKLWLDYSRAFACMLVAIGHLIMSFFDAGILEKSFIPSFFIKFIYYFHVYIFFFVSGFLMKSSAEKFTTVKDFTKYKLIRCTDFLIPYFIFSLITYCIKVLLSSNVNSPVDNSLADALFISPLNQMWYLYAIIVIIAFMPLIKSEKTLYVLLATALALKILTFLPFYTAPTPIDYLFKNSIWFVLGYFWAYKDITLKKPIVFIITPLFAASSVFVFIFDFNNDVVTAILTMLALLSAIEIIRLITKNKDKISGIWKYLSKYMLQIYLLHTICAAGIRVILIRLNITNLIIHTIAGLIFSFVIPIICAMFAERFRIFNIVFFPSKTIKSFSQKQRLDI